MGSAPRAAQRPEDTGCRLPAAGRASIGLLADLGRAQRHPGGGTTGARFASSRHDLGPRSSRRDRRRSRLAERAAGRTRCDAVEAALVRSVPVRRVRGVRRVGGVQGGSHRLRGSRGLRAERGVSRLVKRDARSVHIDFDREHRSEGCHQQEARERAQREARHPTPRRSRCHALLAHAVRSRSRITCGRRDDGRTRTPRRQEYRQGSAQFTDSRITFS